VDRAEVAALDTLQHGLAGDAEGSGGDLNGNPAGGVVVGDESPDGIGEPDPPGRARGDLLAGDVSVVVVDREPPDEGDGVLAGCGRAAWAWAGPRWSR